MTVSVHAQNLLDFIDASPSPWHAAANLETRLKRAEFKCLNEADRWLLGPGERYYVVRDDSSLIAFVTGSAPLVETGFKIVGAHTDSPGLRIKPQPVQSQHTLCRFGVEIYGSPILATFSDRDLSLAGRVSYKNRQGKLDTQLVWIKQPIVRLANLAIHLNRSVNDEGLKLDKQQQLSLLHASLDNELPKDYFLTLIAEQMDCRPEQLLSWDLNVYDTQPGAFWGAQQEFYADSQLDNLASCHAAIDALLDEKSLASGGTSVCAFFDHEEIGSETLQGANGSFLADVLQRIALNLGCDCEGYRQALAQSFMISADMAHAYQPNYSQAYDAEHKVMVNKGPVIKMNVNHRYTSESFSAGQFMMLCEQAGVSWQMYSHRNDMPCGSTIGPMLSAKLGIPSVDVGSPMWAMHSIRESAGVYDHADMTSVLRFFFLSEPIYSYRHYT